MNKYLASLSLIVSLLMPFLSYANESDDETCAPPEKYTPLTSTYNFRGNPTEYYFEFSGENQTPTDVLQVRALDGHLRIISLEVKVEGIDVPILFDSETEILRRHCDLFNLDLDRPRKIESIKVIGQAVRPKLEYARAAFSAIKP